MYVCQSFSWLTSFLKLGLYWDISSSGWDIFLIFMDTFLGCWHICYKWFWISCMSVSLAVCLIPYQNQIKGYIQFWMRYLFGIFWRHSWDVGTLVPSIYDFFLRYSQDVGTLATNDSEFHVCLSVCLFAYFFTKIRQRDISSSEWDISLDFYGDIPKM